MLQIKVPSHELFDESTETFFNTKEYVLNLEHSLLSISKWESLWHKPFLSIDEKDKRTPKEMLSYIKCMTLNKNIPDYVYLSLTEDDLLKIDGYINDPMTATTVKKTGANRDIITSEVIYYWMVAYRIPFECEKWHINRLMMLIKVCNAMNNTKKSKPDMASRRRINEARLKASQAERVARQKR